jgi:hypothetical protein
VAVARFVLWNLGDSLASLADVRAELPYVENETWFSDEFGDRLGSFAIFPDAAAAAEPFPQRLREVIGKDPDLVEIFDVE